MSEPTSHLLIDIGNSRIKYAFVKTQACGIEVRHCATVQQLGPTLGKVQAVWLASVGKADLVEQIEQMCLDFGIDCHVAKTQAVQFDICCAYKNYQNLGVDRWLAILAARKVTASPVAVLDLGTANTCDIVIANQHVGGWISPGFAVMKKSLLSNTQQVFADECFPQKLAFGVSTPEAVNYGCMAAVHGLVALAEKYLSVQAKNYTIFVTGGDQNLLFSLNNKKIHFFPNLVLLGLQRFLPV